MLQRRMQLNDQFLSMDDFARLLHKQPSFGKVLREFVKENMLDKTVLLTPSSGKEREIPVFYYGAKKSKNFSFGENRHTKNRNPSQIPLAKDGVL